MNIRVSARVMPLQEKEIASGYINSVEIVDSSIKLQHPENKQHNLSFQFDNYFDQTATQQLIFEAIGQPFLQSCIQGYNCCMMFLGETGSGKTYTMFGQQNEKMGIISRFITRLLSNRTNIPSIKVSVIDISSNQKIYDCLCYHQTAQGKLKSQRIKGDYHQSWKKINSIQSFNQTIKLVQKNKTILSTCTKQKNSRFSSIITFDLKWTDGKTSTIKFVKLAGVEYLKIGKQDENIKHKSLNTLKNILKQLVQNQAGRSTDINYAQSYLTSSLKQALGGNCKTNLICTINPSSRSYIINQITLELGAYASKVGNKPSIIQLQKVQEKSHSDSSIQQKKQQSCQESQ